LNARAPLRTSLVLACALGLPAWAQQCVPPGTWAAPRSPQPLALASKQVLDHAASRSVVLLGESHDRVEHHRWQLHMMSALLALRGELVLGFEMFPRRVQPALDRWVAGELTEAQFLQQSDWAQVWGFEAALYLPLFHFARMHRIPMIALNVERSLVREVGRKGGRAVPESMREGVGYPEPAPAAYVKDLYEVYLHHGNAGQAPSAADPAFLRFVDSQTLWDRAMAEAIRDARRRYPARQVVAIMGRGHTLPGAVPHQLRALGVADTTTLLPWDGDPDCSDLEPGIADAVFGLDALRAAMPDAAQRPRLGVVLAAAGDGTVRIEQVSDGSVAAEAGLRAGDVVLTLAGRSVASAAEAIGVIGRQAPGTWLPLRVRRGGDELDVVAKFPPPSF
jgi:uncharacterized iron-regulated protein